MLASRVWGHALVSWAGVVTLFQVSRETFTRVVGSADDLLKADPEAHKHYLSIKL